MWLVLLVSCPLSALEQLYSRYVAYTRNFKEIAGQSASLEVTNKIATCNFPPVKNWFLINEVDILPYEPQNLLLLQKFWKVKIEDRVIRFKQHQLVNGLEQFSKCVPGILDVIASLISVLYWLRPRKAAKTCQVFIYMAHQLKPSLSRRHSLMND